MPHNNSYDDIIIKLLYEKTASFTQIFDTLRCTSPMKVIRGTVDEHLNKMVTQGIIEKDDRPRWRNKVFYFLSDKTRSRIRYAIFTGPRAKRKAALTPAEQEVKEQSEANRKALLSLLLQAADGSARWKPVTGKPEPGCVAIASSSSPTGSVMCSLEHEPGVTVEDLTEHKDVGNDGIFGQVNFEESIVDDLIGYLKKDGLGHSLQVIVRTTPNIGIKIWDERLKRLIDYIACLVSSVEDNIRYMWIYKKKPSKSGSWDQEWYMSFYGKERTHRVLMEVKQKRAKIRKERNKRKKLEMIQYGEELFRLAGRSVVGIYHCEITCDKYEYPLHDERKRRTYEKYREFIREVVNKGDHRYSYLLHDLLDLVYPEPLCELHKTDPYLKKYVDNLPDRPLAQWTNIPVI